ncbi:MAG: hypothetical protein ABEI13_03390, partial [Candidatus Paceibacteria bacterium]
KTGTFDIQDIASKSDSLNVWQRLKKGELKKEEVREAYRENLEVALPAVKQLIRNLSGKTVVTSDHGNVFGELVFPIPIRIYGHPAGFRLEGLTKVPWVEFSYDNRRNIEPESN